MKKSYLLNFNLAALLVKSEPVFLIILTFILILVLCTPFIVWIGYKLIGNRILNYNSYKRFEEFVVRYLDDPKSRLTLYCLVMVSVGLFFLVTLFLLYFFFVVYFDLHLDQYITWNLVVHSWNNPLYVAYTTLLFFSFILLMIAWNNILFWNDSVRFWIIWSLALIGGLILLFNFFNSL